MAIQGGGANMMWTDLLGAVGKGALPGDLMIEILGRLPIKSILRFKSVCRSWNALFMSPIFIQHHFTIAGSSAAMNNTLSLIVNTQTREGNNQILSLVLDESLGNPIMNNLSPPFEDNGDEIQVVGSINGLVCISPWRDATSFVLWNPATRESFQTPKPSLVLEREERVSLGFAYDQKSESYKVIRILYTNHFSASMGPARVEIYNTRTSAWRMMEVVDFPWLCYEKTCSALVGGVPYWYAVELQKEKPMFQELMTWFDAADDCFRHHNLPFYHNLDALRVRVGVMGDHPVVIVYSKGGLQQDGWVELWKLKKPSDGGKDVLFWKKTLTLKNVCGLERAIGCWRNGEIIAEDKCGALIIYDPLPKQIKDVPSRGTSGAVEVYGYTESLVSPSRLCFSP